jgi:glucosamine 6-phosphate synthetase-like amidotransferase/phosphosugar isomerase protein
MNHGPIALIGEGMAVIIVAPTGEFCDKTDSILEAAAARGGG